jgi:hypothetical protein
MCLWLYGKLHKEFFFVLVHVEFVPVGIQQLQPVQYILQPDAAPGFLRVVALTDMDAVAEFEKDAIPLVVQP